MKASIRIVYLRIIKKESLATSRRLSDLSEDERKQLEKLIIKSNILQSEMDEPWPDGKSSETFHILIAEIEETTIGRIEYADADLPANCRS